VSEVAPADYADASKRTHFDVTIFDRVTPVDRPSTSALYLDPRGPGAPVRVEGELKNPGFDKIDRKHPSVRFLALDDVNVAAARRLVPQPGDRVVGASDGGASPILVAGVRDGQKFVALGFDVRQSDLPLRPAWPLFVIDCIEWFTDEGGDYLSSYRTGEVWRVPVASTSDQATVTLPDGTKQTVAVHDGRAVFVGERAGYYSVAGAGESHPVALAAAFAANLADAGESAIAPRDKLVVDGAEAGAVTGYHLGVRREIWVYLLLAAALLTALEWGTYHRRVTI
jgi:hypothetical protein